MRSLIAIAVLAAPAHADPTCEQTKQALEQRCAARNLDACLELGGNHLLGPAADRCYPKADPKLFISALEKLCSAGDAFRCGQLADNLLPKSINDGLGLAPDRKRAIELYVRACNLGYDDACDVVLVAQAPSDTQAAIEVRRANANVTLTRLKLHACDVDNNFAACLHASERLRVGAGISKDTKRADALLAKSRVLEKQAMDAFRKLHGRDW
jgi:TPR repeat protein